MSASVDDQRAVQGKWLTIRYENVMVSKSPLNRLPRHLLLIAGNSVELALPGRNPTDVGTFVLDAGTIPRTITWVTTIGQKAGNPLRGIYDLLSDRLVLVTAGAFKPQRPSFAAP